MKGIFHYTVKKIRHLLKVYRLRKTNLFVKKFYKQNNNSKIKFERNVWNKNIYWDFFYQNLPHSIKSKYFVPYDYYSLKIEDTMNNPAYSAFVVMKNMYDKVFGNTGVKLPKTILRCMNYIYMDAEYNSVDNIPTIISNIKQDIIVKAASDSYGGFSIKKYYFKDNNLIESKLGYEFNLENLQSDYKGSFIIQEVVDQHPDLAKFHPYSLNTIRVMSYRSVRTNEVVIPMAMLRMGVDQSIVDNASSNGVAVSINESGKLNNLAFNQFGKHYEKHPSTNVGFEGCSIPSYEKIKEATKLLSNIVPYQRIIGWDFSIDINGDPVLIELNIGTGTWMYQIVTGRPLFGEYTFEIKEYMDSLRKK